LRTPGLCNTASLLTYENMPRSRYSMAFSSRGREVEQVIVSNGIFRRSTNVPGLLYQV
jgi:hypothetical protein